MENGELSQANEKSVLRDRRSRFAHSPFSSGAYTLFEVLIALALMSTVIALISVSTDIYLRNMVVNRSEVEEAQLARALLEKIAKDIRNVVVAVREEQLEVDTESLSSLFGFSAGLDESYLASGTASNEMESSEADSSSEDETEVYGTIPGIYGDLEWLQIDTAQLPRGEMFGSRQVRSGTSALADRLSPSKTILYYLGKDTGQISDQEDPRYQPENLIGSLGRHLDQTALQYGLFRRQLDRMVSQYAVNEGLETEYEQYDEPIAPEVEWIKFAYFDPTASQQQNESGDWIEYWDMDEMQCLPTAIRITIGFRRQRFGTSFFSGQSNDEISTVVYSLVVPIPVTVDLPPDETTTETQD